MRLTARQNTPAIDAAIYYLDSALYQLQPSFHTQFDGTGADGPRSEGGKRILLDNSRVYVRFLPFVSGRVHLGRAQQYSAILGGSVRAARNVIFAPHVWQKGPKPRPASISDATIQMDHNAVVLFTIDRLARSPRTTVRDGALERPQTGEL